MNVLVATTETQGAYESDFFWAIEGELVMFGWICDRDPEDDGPCGCRRSLCGVMSGKGTTTFKVAERSDLRSVGDLAAEFVAAIERGWLLEDEPDDMASHMCEVAESYAIGSVLELRDGILQRRITGEAAIESAEGIVNE